MDVAHRDRGGGWWIPVTVGLSLGGAGLVAALSIPEGVEAARFMIRLTARTSLVLFLLAFTASALVRVAQGPPTLWIRAHRRFLGVGFAVSHLVHAAALVVLARLDYATFQKLTNIGSFVGGGLAYAFIALMAGTSFDGAVRALGARNWRLLHLVGGWYIWVSFALNFGKRMPLDPVYLLPVALLVSAGFLRLLGNRRGRIVSRSMVAPNDP